MAVCWDAGRDAAPTPGIDFDLCGHQIVAHLAPKTTSADAGANPVDGHDVPVPHFGVVLEMADWEAMAERLRTAGVSFGIEPHVRFPGQPGEQATMFFRDPVRQRAGVQGVPRPWPTVRQVGRRPPPSNEKTPRRFPGGR